MKIGFDISMLAYKGSGVANYTFNLVKNLLKYDKKNEYKLFYSSLRKPKNFYVLKELEKSGGKVYNLPLPHSLLRLIWNKLNILPIEWLIGQVDVFFSSDYLRPPLSRCTKGVTMIHDLIWKLHPEWHNSDIVELHNKKLEKTIRYKDVIFVPSFSTKRDLIENYPQIKKRNNVYVIYEGIGEEFKEIKNKKAIKKVLRKYHVRFPANYLLYVGAIEPRKNLESAIINFYNFIKDKKYEKYQLLIVGRAGWKNENIFKLIEILNLEKKVKFIGFVEDHDLPFFYSSAKLLIYLSHYEGFGLPPLEAARCGTPSLIYSNSSLKEIFPKNYLFAEEGDELSTLKEILTKGKRLNLSFAKKFNWKSYCSKFIKVIKKYEN